MNQTQDFNLRVGAPPEMKICKISTKEQGNFKEHQRNDDYDDDDELRRRQHDQN